jgi:hypothetical protein
VVDHDCGCQDQTKEVQAVVSGRKRLPDRTVSHPVCMFGRIRDVDDSELRVRMRDE